MNEKVKKYIDILKSPKILLVIGIIGIILIFLSSLFPSEKSSETKSGDGSLTPEEYKEQLEDSVMEIVKAVTGDRKPTVVITLESGIRYTYADSLKADTTSSSNSDSAQNSESETRSYITVKDSDGGEKALIITENMPKVRGVAIVCDGGNGELTAEKIKNAVTAALDITEKRVYVSGGK